MFSKRWTPFFGPTTLLMLAMLLFALALAGCAATGQEKPRSAEDGLRYAQATMAGIYTTIGNAAAARTLPAADARKYFDRLERPSKDLETVDAAVRALPPGGVLPTDAVALINISLTVLTQVAAELRARLPAEQTKTLVAR